MGMTEALQAESAVMAVQPVAKPFQGEAGDAAMARTAVHPAAVNDPVFDHWIVVYGRVIGEAHSVTHGPGDVSSAMVRLFCMLDMAAYESIDSERLKPKVVH